eukprot:TRINITY_DN5879_c0_g2_i1.p1 TRINITY_DN5879_c0_g2~~TRINITY_DN5879_c0_g2_i1.p1  ORF type:complete len:290 (+),score=-15.93 TRINITY_DN5879_c0_g2_i1:119-988(+)
MNCIFQSAIRTKFVLVSIKAQTPVPFFTYKNRYTNKYYTLCYIQNQFHPQVLYSYHMCLTSNTSQLTPASNATYKVYYVLQIQYDNSCKRELKANKTATFNTENDDKKTPQIVSTIYTVLTKQITQIKQKQQYMYYTSITIILLQRKQNATSIVKDIPTQYKCIQCINKDIVQSDAYYLSLKNQSMQRETRRIKFTLCREAEEKLREFTDIYIYRLYINVVYTSKLKDQISTEVASGQLPIVKILTANQKKVCFRTGRKDTALQKGVNQLYKQKHKIPLIEQQMISKVQ